MQVCGSDPPQHRSKYKHEGQGCRYVVAWICELFLVLRLAKGYGVDLWIGSDFPSELFYVVLFSIVNEMLRQ